MHFIDYQDELVAIQRQLGKKDTELRGLHGQGQEEVTAPNAGLDVDRGG